MADELRSPLPMSIDEQRVRTQPQADIEINDPTRNQLEQGAFDSDQIEDSELNSNQPESSDRCSRHTKSNLEAYIRLELKLRPTTLLLLTIKVDSGAHNLLNIKLDLTKYLLHTAKRFPLVKFLRGLWQLFFCLTSDL